MFDLTLTTSYPLVLHLTNTLEDFLKGKDQGSVAEGDSKQVSLCSTFKVVYLGSWFHKDIQVYSSKVK